MHTDQDWSQLTKWLQKKLQLSLLFLLGTAGQLHASHASPLYIAAATGLQQALPELIQLFHTQHPEADIRVTYGSSGVLTAQLRHGAPFELFLSSNRDYVYSLHRLGYTLDSGVDYAYGRIAFFTREEIQARSAAEAITQMHSSLSMQHRIAIANPLHAPYGFAALNWLESVLPEQEITSRIVLGENAAQATQFILSGAARSGVVAWSLLSQREHQLGRTWLIPQAAHPPIIHRMVLMPHASHQAQDFYHFLLTEQAQETLVHFGFGAL